MTLAFDFERAHNLYNYLSMWDRKVVYSYYIFLCVLLCHLNSARKRFLEARLNSLDQQSFTIDSYPNFLETAKEKKDIHKRFLLLTLETIFCHLSNLWHASNYLDHCLQQIQHCGWHEANVWSIWKSCPCSSYLPVLWAPFFCWRGRWIC